MKDRTVPSEDPLMQRLNSVANTHPDLRAAARLYEVILPLVRDADSHVELMQLDRDRIRSGLEAGEPVLSELALKVDFQKLEEFLLRLIHAVESMETSERRGRSWKSWLRSSDTKTEPGYRSLKAAAAHIRLTCEEGRLDLGEILGYAAVGDHGKAAERADSLQLDGGLLWTLAQKTLKPILNSCRREIAPLTTGLQWDKGYCYICGSGATLGELQDNDQVKHLRCGQCGADWHFNRLQCPHCGNTDHQTQQCLYVGGCESRRIETCDLCRGYLKVIASFAPTPSEMLAVEDLATLHLDFIAQQRGYTKSGIPPDHAQGEAI